MQINIKNINFNELLLNELNVNNDLNDNKDDNLCLISNEKLDDSQIELLCGHKFNYLHIYKEVIKQKNCCNSLNIINLKKNQIQCPYCRSIQNSILPFKPYPDIKRIYGINSPKDWEMLLDKCTYIFKSGKNKGKYCEKLCNGKFCNKHINISIQNKVNTDKNINYYEYDIKRFVEKESIDKLNLLKLQELRNFARKSKIEKYYKLNKLQLKEILIKSIES